MGSTWDPPRSAAAGRPPRAGRNRRSLGVEAYAAQARARGRAGPEEGLSFRRQGPASLAGAERTAEQGAGLGLPIVQKIMELHQGRFDLFSKLRFGTEVIATFPRARVMDALAPVVERKNRLHIYSEAR